MDIKNKNIPQTFLENIDMVNSATQFMNYKNNDDMINLNLNIKQKMNNKNQILFIIQIVLLKRRMTIPQIFKVILKKSHFLIM
jgi:hypothetical protein